MLKLFQADATAIPLEDKSVDLVFGSPPYMDARTYGIGASRKCQAWIDWMLTVTVEALRISRGLVIWVVAGVTRDWTYQPGPEGLLYEWWKAGGSCFRPVIWNRIGIPGSGGEQWLRADTEYCLAFKRPGRLPWADNTAMGHKPKWAPGGELSHRKSDGTRLNQWGGNMSGANSRRPNGSRQKPGRPSYKKTMRRCARGKSGEDTKQENNYTPPVKANPGNLIRTKVGNGHMGHRLAHENEAPFPEALAEWFILSWCPPGGTVLDPFIGSGTTAAVALKHNRHAIGTDIRASQIELAQRRCAEITPHLF